MGSPSSGQLLLFIVIYRVNQFPYMGSAVLGEVQLFSRDSSHLCEGPVAGPKGLNPLGKEKEAACVRLFVLSHFAQGCNLSWYKQGLTSLSPIWLLVPVRLRLTRERSDGLPPHPLQDPPPLTHTQQQQQ